MEPEDFLTCSQESSIIPCQPAESHPYFRTWTINVVQLLSQEIVHNSVSF
jgi:hypothetical protein